MHRRDIFLYIYIYIYIYVSWAGVSGAARCSRGLREAVGRTSALRQFREISLLRVL